MKFFLLLSCTGLLLTICNCSKPLVETDQLLVLNSQKLGSNNMKILTKETEFSNNISTIENKVYKRGSAAGSSMFGMCSFIHFAKKRGYSLVVIRDSSSNYNCDDCDDCEWESTMKIGYIKDVNPTSVSVPSMQFKNMADSKEVEVRKVVFGVGADVVIGGSLGSGHVKLLN